MEVRVDCRATERGWRCNVGVGTDPAATAHAVTVSGDTLRELAPTDADPVRLVTESFHFLLAHEPRESILRSFDLPVIGRYFPGWEREVRARLGER
ncbi:MAG TPA: hypothetical protein VIA82_03175 [Candidatus Limnocylindria bacterium]|jgi:hypothetical protein